jgi:hypothetical protein
MNAKVIARLTVIRRDGNRTIVEVHTDARFHSFYHFYQQQGRRYSTKKEFRTASRNEGLPVINTHLQKPDLALIEKRLQIYGAQSNPVVETRIRIIRKRAYKRLINAAPDQLGLSRVGIVDLRLRKPIPVQLPEPKKRYSVLTGWSR